ncbi:hypothetical protein J3L16_01825 [Alteromonas sp. 5E99-2]|uniref:hypothetical protein n=1 Tax=Alteromonas sp. 5E99-2 TaxID=2817683 RepID=UPI001A989FAD|nr:hypothetical protein [Alteromonas sp. 5E99-2]MBO1254419.1 hypothetical protein [Alteromonas sp. 5E99-2]
MKYSNKTFFLFISLVLLYGCGGGGNDEESNDSPVVVSVNLAPVISLLDEYSVLENTVETNIELLGNASDPEQDPITFALGEQGDSALFLLDTDSSELLFKTAPDFEAPIDAGSNNIYQVEVVYTDSHGDSSSKLLDVNVTDESNLQLSMTYPTPNANLGGSPQTTIRGTLVDLEDGDVSSDDVDAVQVNGLTAVLDESNTLWSATANLTEVDSTIEVGVVQKGVTTQSVNYQLQSEALPIDFENLTDGFFNSEDNSLILVDRAYRTIFELDLTTNEIHIVSNAIRGTGPILEMPQAIAWDSNNNRVFVSDINLDAIVSINLSTGDRVVISDDTTGFGFPLSSPSSITFDNTENLLYVMDSTLDALIKIDIDSGDREIVSDRSAFFGDSVLDWTDAVLDIDNNIGYLSSTSEGKIYRINLDTGNRTLIADVTTGAGITIENPGTLAFNAEKNQLFVLGESMGEDSVFSVDLATLERTLVSGPSAGEGINLLLLRNIILDNTGENAWILDGGVESIIYTELATGKRTLLPVTESSTFADPIDIELNTAEQRILVSDSTTLYSVDVSATENAGAIDIVANTRASNGVTHHFTRIGLDEQNNKVFLLEEPVFNGEAYFTRTKTLIAIDLNTGNRTDILDVNTLYGRSAIGDFTYDHSSNRIIYADYINNAFVAIDVDSKEFTVLAKDVRDDINNRTYSFILNFALDIKNNRIIAVSAITRTVLSVDIDTGSAIIVSNNSVGSGLDFIEPEGVVYDEANNRVLVTDEGLNQVIAVDLTTGNRSVLSDTSVNVPFNDLFSPVLDVKNNRLFTTDITHDAIYVIDIPSGERAIVAH